jgi:hypothetical protein
LDGYFSYHAIPGNMRTMDVFRTQVVRAWLYALRRRSQRKGKRLTWERFARIADEWLPRARCRQDWPSERFYAIHPR